jgi:hypothetical protein
VFASRGWMRFALLLNLFGTALLFYSFQATSSNVRIVTAPDGTEALCMNQTALFILRARGSEIGMIGPCPDQPNSRAIAVVNIEYPILVTIGFLILVSGFLVQVLSIPGTKTIAQMRKELKAAVMRDKIDKLSR